MLLCYRYFQLHQVRIPSDVSQRKLDSIVNIENGEEVRERDPLWLWLSQPSSSPTGAVQPADCAGQPQHHA